jgi:hypothetical protein
MLMFERVERDDHPGSRTWRYAGVDLLLVQGYPRTKNAGCP